MARQGRTVSPTRMNANVITAMPPPFPHGPPTAFSRELRLSYTRPRPFSSTIAACRNRELGYGSEKVALVWHGDGGGGLRRGDEWDSDGESGGGRQ